MSDLKSLREERGKMATAARELVDKAEEEKRDLTDEEKAKFDELHDKIADHREKIEREEKQRELERELETAVEPGPEGRADPNREDRADPPILNAFRSWLQSGTANGDGAQEFRDLQATVNTEGGYLVAPEQFVQQLIKNVDDMLFFRSMATTFPLAMAASIGVPVLDADPADADWTSELATGSEDSNMALGKRSMQPHPLAKRIKVSNQLLRQSIIPADQLVMDRLGYKFGVTQEKAYLTGNGVRQPLGVYTAHADGIPTSRDVSEDNNGTEVTTDGLINAKYTLKSQYWNNADWIFHRDGVKQIAKLKDGEGQYLWSESVRDGEPDRLLGRPIHMSEFNPNTFTTGQYVGILGDFSHYWIIDALTMQMQRLVELYAETNQVGFIGRYEGDGQPVLAEAFVRVKLG